MSNTTWSNKIKILSEVSAKFDQPQWADFIARNHRSVALCHYIERGNLADHPAVINEEMVEDIEYSFDMLLAGYGILEDTGFDSLDIIQKVAE